VTTEATAESTSDAEAAAPKRRATTRKPAAKASSPDA
jgi:hypothetical protein